jgi:hypothetical protein
MIERDLGAFRALLLAFPLIVASVYSHACGVAIRDSFEGTEVFKGISLSGAASAGDAGCVRGSSAWRCSGVSQLTVHLTVTNGYPVPVQVACYLEDSNLDTELQDKIAFHERAPMVAETTLQPKPGLKPGDKHLPKEPLDMTFTAPPPGDYFIACLTPAAPENGLGLNFSVS